MSFVIKNGVLGKCADKSIIESVIPENSIKNCTIKDIIQNGIRSLDDCEIMGNSLYYYCAGIDPTPIFAFGSNIPLYIYVDSLIYIIDDLDIVIKKLVERILQNGNFILEDCDWIDASYKGKSRIVMQWRDLNGKQFYVAYIVGDLNDVFRELYSHNNNLIQPKCICNIRHEAIPTVLHNAEKRVEWIMGYCCDEKKYSKVGSFPYHGDYSEAKVELFKRRFYYVW